MAKKKPFEKYLAAKESLMKKGVRTHNDFLGLVKNKYAVDEDPAVAKILNLVQENVVDKYSLRRLIDLVRDREEHYKNLIKQQRKEIDKKHGEVEQYKDEVKAEQAEKGVLVGTIKTLQTEIEMKNETIAKLNKFNRSDVIDIPDEIDRAELLDFEEGDPEIVQDLGDDEDIESLSELDDSDNYDDDDMCSPLDDFSEDW